MASPALFVVACKHHRTSARPVIPPPNPRRSRRRGAWTGGTRKKSGTLRAGPAAKFSSLRLSGRARGVLEASGPRTIHSRTAYSIAALPASSYAVQAVFGSLCAFSNFSKHAGPSLSRDRRRRRHGRSRDSSISIASRARRESRRARRVDHQRHIERDVADHLAGPARDLGRLRPPGERLDAAAAEP